jgi:hypothetical protein
MIFIAFNGEIADESIHVKIHINATLATATLGMVVKSREVRIKGVTII